MPFILIGNYGVANIGDEALKEYFLSRFADIEWKTVSAHPSSATDIPRLPAGIRSFFTAWPKTILAMLNSDGIVFGGGTLFTDIESVMACVMWWLYAFIASLFHRPIFLAFQGIGPFRTKLGKGIARWVIRRSFYISVRDEESYRRVVELKGSADSIVQTFDAAFGLLANDHPSASSKTLVIIPRHNSSREFIDKAADMALNASLASVKVLLMHPEEDRIIADKLMEKLGSQARIIDITSLSQLKDEIADASFVLTQRYHGGIAALAQDIPFETMSQAAGDKLSTLDSSMREVYRERLEKGEKTLREALGNVECRMHNESEKLRFSFIKKRQP